MSNLPETVGERAHVIVSLVPEEAWMSVLRGLSAWQQPDGVRVVLVAPHPDDETLGVGGLLAALRRQKIEVLVAAVTDGENAYPEQNAQARAETGSSRRAEQSCALARLGIEPHQVVRLGLPDSNVTAYEDALIEQLSEFVDAGTLLVAPWQGDFHPDHEACGRAARRVALKTGAALISYFFWTWHRGTPETLTGLPLRRFALSEQDLSAKTEALACHRTQLQREAGEPILPERLLGPARRRFEVFAIA